MIDESHLQERLGNYATAARSLQDYLRSYSRGRQRKVLLARLGAMIAALIGTALVFLLVERTPLQSEVARVACGLLFYGFGIAGILSMFRALFHPPPSVRLAQELEAVDPRLGPLLINATEFAAWDSVPPGTSAALARLTVSQAAETLRGEDRGRALERFRIWPAWAVFLLLAGLLAIWHALSPHEVERGLARLRNPFTPLAPYAGLTLLVHPGNILVAKGESVQISAVPSHIPESEPVLTLFAPGEEKGTPTEMYPDEAASTARYVFTLNGLQESTDYQVALGTFVSERHSIKVLPRPEIKALQLTVHQPEYLGSGPLILPENTGEATVLAGTRIDLAGRASQFLATAVLSLETGMADHAGPNASSPASTPEASLSTLTCTIDRERFQTSFAVATTTRYQIHVANTSGLTNENPVKYQITAVEDATPTVTILKPGADLPFPQSKRLDLKVAARDDFGVVAVVMQYSVGDRRHTIPQNLKADFTPMKEFEVEFPWMLDTVPVMPGTEISYYVRAEDGVRPVPHVATTPTFRITMPSMYDVYRGSDQAQGDVTKKLDEMLESQKMRREALQQALEEVRHEGKLDEETAAKLEEQIRRDAERDKEAQEILQNLDQVRDRLQENPFSSPEALEKMQKVQELLNEVLDDEAKKMMNQLRESLQNMKVDPKDLEKYEQAFKMEEYLKNLDRSIELLKQVREDLKLNALGQAAQDLLERQKAIASETAALEQKAKDGELGPEEQSRLNDLQKQQDKIKEELARMEKEAQELAQKQPAPGEQQNPAKEDLKNLSDRMKQEDHQKLSEEIKKNLEQKNLDQAKQQQQKMLKFLESLAKDGQKMCQTCSGGQAPQLDLSRFIRKALTVSTDQEALLQRLDGFPGQFMRGHMPAIEGRVEEVSVLQLLVKRQAQQLEDALEAFVRQSIAVDPSVLQPLAGVQGMLGEIIKQLEDRQIDRSRQDQREIIRRFNRLAMELMRTQDQSSQQQSGSQASALEQFKQLARRQLSLYQQSQRQQQMNPGDRQMMQDLQKRAMEQRMVREALEKLMRESRQQTQTLGRMDDVIKDMQDLETRILDPKLQREVGEKQKNIYDRMLKAQKSLKRRDEESEERKAEKARERVQMTPDKPLPTAGSDTRDLSKDYLTDLKETFPRSYENELRDYYRSLNLYRDEAQPSPVTGE